MVSNLSGGAKTASSCTSSVGSTSHLPQHMYFVEGGLLVVSNLLKTEAWVNDGDRSHCNICVQQFLPFRRRHHCRTCGEVVCGSCSAQRKIHLTEVNVECSTRVCSFCMIRATDAAINANEAVRRETLLLHTRQVSTIDEEEDESVGSPTSNQRDGLPTYHHQRHHSVPTNPNHAIPTSNVGGGGGGGGGGGAPPLPPRAPRHVNVPVAAAPSSARLSKQFSMLSMESELTDGSVVQIWPPPVSDSEELARLQVARHSTIRTAERDPTMSLLVSIVARTLECPVAFIGILEDDANLWFKASVGWDRTHVPRDDCVAALLNKTMVAADTNVDKHFHAATLAIGASPMRYYAGAPIRVLGQCIGAVAAIDITPHWTTSASMRSTLEAVANIVSEVLEQRVDNNGRSSEPLMSLARPLSSFLTASSDSTSSSALTMIPATPPALPSSAPAAISPLLRKTTSLSSCGSASTFADLNDSLQDLAVIDPLLASSSESEDDDEDDDDIVDGTMTSAIHPWPSFVSQTRMSIPRFSLALPSGPPELGDNIAKAMDFFQVLQSSRWQLREADESIRAFELSVQGRQFTKSHATMRGDCTHVLAALQTYDDARVYADLFTSVTQRRQRLCVNTWVDHVQLRAGTTRDDADAGYYYSEVRVVSHWRQYPDGSHVVVAFNDSNPDLLLMVEDFLFGWFIAPVASPSSSTRKPSPESNLVNVSCIVGQPAPLASGFRGLDDNQSLEENLSLQLLRRLQQSLPLHYDVRASLDPFTTAAVVDNQSCHQTQQHENQDQHGHELDVDLSFPLPSTLMTSVDESSTTDFHDVDVWTPPAALVGKRGAATEKRTRCASSHDALLTSESPSTVVALRQKFSTDVVSNLNENERMMLDLLDKTISTQEVLAAQQHVMANVMDYHGTQLQRISNAIDRVETILSHNGDKLRRLQNRHSISS
ncbi:hypothetical protein PINS_up016463 [Pythium insidiosum]|nr:hypothetical protein PINS_up016463 [Pythium insidiosum]